MMMPIKLLQTAFFLQGAYVLTYIPLMMILLTLGLHYWGRLSVAISFMVSMQSVITAYVCVACVSVIVALMLAFTKYPFFSNGIKPVGYYYGAIGFSALVYAGVQYIFLAPYRAQIACNSGLLILICNGLAAICLIGMHTLLFVYM